MFGRFDRRATIILSRYFRPMVQLMGGGVKWLSEWLIQWTINWLIKWLVEWSSD